MHKDMIQGENQLLPFDKKKSLASSNSSNNSLQESFEMTSLSSDSEHARDNIRNSIVEKNGGGEMTAELSIHTSMLKGQEDRQNLNSQTMQRQESDFMISEKMVDLTVDQFIGATSREGNHSCYNQMRKCLKDDLRKHNINYLTAAYFLTLKHEFDDFN